jgi:hypothetical protein
MDAFPPQPPTTPPSTRKRKGPSDPPSPPTNKTSRSHHQKPPFHITDENIHALVDAYLTDKQLLPHELQNVPIGQWVVTEVTNMDNLFKDRHQFNEDLSEWDTQNVISMKSMFENATSFNQPLPWNVETVENMESMFQNATSFNSPLTDWNPFEIVNTSKMFMNATAFNQPLHWGDIREIEDLSHMFHNATSFNSPIIFGYHRPENTSYMFAGATSFNQPLLLDTGEGNHEIWTLDYTLEMQHMFHGATSFNQPLQIEDAIEDGTNLESMFEDATSFNQTLDWRFAGEFNFKRMFRNATSFEGNGLQDWELDLDGDNWLEILGRFESMFAGAVHFNMELDWIDPQQIPPHAQQLFNSVFQGAGPNARFVAPDDNQHQQLQQQMVQAPAFEVHNATNYIDKPIVMNILQQYIDQALHVNMTPEQHLLPTNPNTQVALPAEFNIGNWHFGLTNFMHNYIKPLYDNPTHDEQFQTFHDFLERFEVSVNRARAYTAHVDNELINKVIQFLHFQNAPFIKFFIENFTYDCTTAYGEGGLSCAKGAYERIIISLGTAASKYLSLPNIQNTRRSPLQFYNVLKSEIEPAAFIPIWAKEYHSEKGFLHPDVQREMGMELQPEEIEGLSEQQIEALLADRKKKRKEHFDKYFKDLFKQAGAIFSPHKQRLIDYLANRWLPDNVLGGGRRAQRRHPPRPRPTKRRSHHKSSKKFTQRRKRATTSRRCKRTKLHNPSKRRRTTYRPRKRHTLRK